MPQSNTLSATVYVVGALSPFALFLGALWHSESSRWIRSVFFAMTLAGIAWGTLGFLSLFYSTHFTRQGRLALDHWKTDIAGIATGLLISALLSPDFWKLSRHYRSDWSWLDSNSKV